MGKQLHLDLGKGLPVPVSALAVKRAACRKLREFGNESARAGFVLRDHVERIALLEQVRQSYRKQVRELKREARREGRRLNGLALVTYVCKPEGRRALRLIDRLAARVAEQERGLCA